MRLWSVPPDTYIVPADEGFYHADDDRGLGWLAFTLKPGTRLFLGSARDPWRDRRSPQSGAIAPSAADLELLRRNGFKFGDGLIPHAVPIGRDPACGGFP